MPTKNRAAALLCAGATILFIVAAPASLHAAIPIRGLGSSSFAIDPAFTLASYTQSTNSLNLSSTFVLGDMLSGVFGSLLNPVALDLRSFPALGLEMSLSGGPTLAAPFTLELFDADFNSLNKFSGETSSVSTNTGVIWLSPEDATFSSLNKVSAMMFTWDGQSSLSSSIAINSLVGARPEGYFTARSPGGFRLFTSTNAQSGLRLGPGESSWSSLSDSNAKTAITAVDHREVLRQVVALPVTRWRYKDDPTRSYIGPMAKDFHDAFDLGLDDKHISTLDTDGVALSALKGLIEVWRERQAVSEAQGRRLQDLQSELIDLQKMLSQLPPGAH